MTNISLGITLTFLVEPSPVQNRRSGLLFVSQGIWRQFEVGWVCLLHAMNLVLNLWCCILLVIACSKLTGNSVTCYGSYNTVFLFCCLENTCKDLFFMCELQPPIKLCKKAWVFSSPLRNYCCSVHYYPTVRKWQVFLFSAGPRTI